jgi:hypothetical protein
MSCDGPFNYDNTMRDLPSHSAKLDWILCTVAVLQPLETPVIYGTDADVNYFN